MCNTDQPTNLDWTKQDVISQLPLPIEDSDWEYSDKKSICGHFSKKLIPLMKLLAKKGKLNEYSF